MGAPVGYGGSRRPQVGRFLEESKGKLRYKTSSNGIPAERVDGNKGRLVLVRGSRKQLSHSPTTFVGLRYDESCQVSPH